MSISFFKEASDKATPSEVLKKAGEQLESFAIVAKKIDAREAYAEGLSNAAAQVREITNAYEGNAPAAKL